MKNLLSSERIASLCRPAAQPIIIQIVDETGSTNADLLAGLEQLAGPTLLIAKSQTAGRGRAGRSWLSAAGKSLTFSLAWKFDVPVHALVGLPLAVGVVIAESLSMFGVTVQLKWPNDGIHEGRKLAGILIESASAASHEASWAVVGIGINMGIGTDIISQVGRPVADVPWLAELDQEMLMATLLNGLAEALLQFEHEGLAVFVDRWNRLHAYRGQPVVILDNGRILHEGLAVGIDNIGRFILDTANGRVTVMAGDVSLRPRED